MVAYLPSLRTFLHRLRATTSTPSSLASTLLSSPLLTAPPLAPSLAETGVEEDTPVDFSKYSSKLVKHPNGTLLSLTLPSFLSSSSSLDVLRQSDTVAKLGLQPGLVLPGAVGTLVSSSTGTATEEEKDEEEEGGRDQGGAERDNTAVECLVQECPSFLHAGLMQLFPGVTLSTEKLTVITVSERTNHDMMAWSHDMEEEREELMEHVRRGGREKERVYLHPICFLSVCQQCQRDLFTDIRSRTLGGLHRSFIRQTG